MLIEILRDRVEPEGTFSKWSIDGEPFSVGVSLPWANNKPGISCAPEGEYESVPYDSPKHGETIVLVNPALHIYFDKHDTKDPLARDKIELHPANWPRQLNGCEAPGVAVARFEHEGWGVTHSRRTMERLRARWKDRKNVIVRIAWTDALRPAQ